MPDVTVLTALAVRPHHRLAEIHRALSAARRTWEWVIQVNGAGALALPPPCPRTRACASGATARSSGSR